MTRRFVPVRRIAALSVAITLFAAPPIASAQSRMSVPPGAAPARTALLTASAFARLVQLPPADLARAPIVSDPVQPSLVRQGTAAMARQAAPAKAPQKKSWASQNKVALGWIIVGGVLGSLVFYRMLTCEDC